MKIFINNIAQEITQENDLSFLLNTMGMEGHQGIAIAVNETVIPKTRWKSFQLNENDKVIIIQATAGG